MVDIDIGDYELDQDSNDDLVIKDPNDNEVMKWDKSNGQWDFGSETLANIRVENVADTASGNTIYDSSSETLGDGNQDVDVNSVSTDEANIRDLLELNFVSDTTDVSGSRSINTTYQNTSNYTWLLYIRLEASADGTTINAQLTASETSGGADIGSRSQDGGVQTVDSGEYLGLSAIVPPDYYWRIRGFGDTGSYSIQRALERELRE